VTFGAAAWGTRSSRADAEIEQRADSATRVALATRRSNARGIAAQLAHRPAPTGARASAGPVDSGATQPVRTGLVRLRVFPVDADISFDGRDVGRGVVLDEAVPAGKRRLRVRAAGYVDYDTTVTIVPGETTQLPRVDLRPREVTQ
jgi:hypothetical protein